MCARSISVSTAKIQEDLCRSNRRGLVLRPLGSSAVMNDDGRRAHRTAGNGAPARLGRWLSLGSGRRNKEVEYGDSKPDHPGNRGGRAAEAKAGKSSGILCCLPIAGAPRPTKLASQSGKASSGTALTSACGVAARSHSVTVGYLLAAGRTSCCHRHVPQNSQSSALPCHGKAPGAVAGSLALQGFARRDAGDGRPTTEACSDLRVGCAGLGHGAGTVLPAPGYFSSTDA